MQEDWSDSARYDDEHVHLLSIDSLIDAEQQKLPWLGWQKI